MLDRQRRARLGRECATTAVLAAPLVAGQLLTIGMNVIDVQLAGRLGTAVLAATSAGYNVWVLALLVTLGILLAVAPHVARLDGAGRRGEVGAVFRQGLWLGLAIGVGFLLLLRQAEPLLVWVGTPPEVVPDALRFLRAISWGAPALALFFVCRNTSEGLSRTRPTLYVSLLGVALLLPLAWSLMYGRLGLPALGAEGAGLAHATILWLQAGAYLAWLRWHPDYAAARLFERFERPSARVIGQLVAVGAPMGFSIFMEGSLFVFTALVAGSFGVVAGSAHAIAMNVASFTFMVPLGIGMATTVRVGNAVGRRDPAGVAWAGAAGFALVLATQLVAAAAILFGAGGIAGLYSDDPAVRELAIALLVAAAWFQLPDGIQGLFNGALRGLEDTRVPALMTVVSYWAVGATLGWWFGRQLGEGPEGLWKGLIAGLCCAALLLGLRFAQRARAGLAALPRV